MPRCCGRLTPKPFSSPSLSSSLGVISSSQCNLVYLPSKYALSTWKNRVLLHPLASRLSCRRPAPPPWTHRKRSPTGSGRPVQIHGYDPLLAVPGESVQDNCPRGYSLWKHGVCTRPEPEAARRETVNAPVAGASFGDIAAASSRNQSVESGSEAGVKPQSGYPLPARQHSSRFRTAHASAI